MGYQVHAWAHIIVHYYTSLNVGQFGIGRFGLDVLTTFFYRLDILARKLFLYWLK